MPRGSKQSDAQKEAAVERDKVLQSSYSKAVTALRDAHIDEFNELRQKFAAEKGVEWTPPLTAEQKALKQIEDLLTEHPSLRETIGLDTAV